MESVKKNGKLQSAYRLIIALLVILIVLVVLLGAAVGWLFFINHQHEEEILQHRKSIAVLWEFVLPLTTLDQFGEGDSDRTKREVISSLNINDLVKNGFRGAPGPMGPPGVQGPPGRDGRDGRDAVNLLNIEKHINTSVVTSVGSEMKKVRLAAKELPSMAGAVYIRWGRTKCPEGTRLISKGVAAATNPIIKGGGSNYLCLPDDPEFDHAAMMPVTSQWLAKLSSVEYQYTREGLSGQSKREDNAPCVYCQADSRPQKLMLPSKTRCPSDWTLEYNGYLMGQPTVEERNRMEFICVDKEAEAVPGQSHYSNGHNLYNVVANCTQGKGNLGNCPPYRGGVIIACVMCSK